MDFVDIGFLVDFCTYANNIVIFFPSVLFFILIVKFKLSRHEITSHGKAVLITGCDSGFGHELAKRLDSKGFHVFATCMFPSAPGAMKLKKSCSSKLHILHMDITQDESVQKGYEYVKGNLGFCDLWAIVNNAGTSRGFSFEFSTIDDFKDSVNVNFLGMVRVTKAFLPLLKQSKGRIVNMSSLIGEMPAPYICPYASSKYAAVGFTDCIRQELDAYGITVVGIEPEAFKTGMTSCEHLNDMKDFAIKSLEVKEDDVAVMGKLSHFLTSVSSDKIYIVVDDLDAAVTLKHPSYTYKPRRNLFVRLIFMCYEIMPRRCQLLVTKCIMAIIFAWY